jgi:tRNA-specific 2-thiouridylase
MPLGGLRKEETRRLAAELGLKVAAKSESQDICFIPDGDYRQFLRQRAPAGIKPGKIRDLAGRVRGEHTGVPFYTIGQRKGRGIAGIRPYYVVGLDPVLNEVIIGDEGDLWSSELSADQVNFIPFEELSEEMEVLVKIRYQHQGARARIHPRSANRVKVKFTEPQRAITPGQAVVFYQEDLLLGGGIISGPNRPDQAREGSGG